MRRLILAASSLALVLVACSQGAESYSGVRDIAAALADSDLGCSNLVEGKDAELLAGAGSCTVGDAQIYIYSFDSPKNRDRWSSLGTRVQPTVTGPDWAIAGPEATVETIADRLGGEISTPR